MQNFPVEFMAVTVSANIVHWCAFYLCESLSPPPLLTYLFLYYVRVTIIKCNIQRLEVSVRVHTFLQMWYGYVFYLQCKSATQTNKQTTTQTMGYDFGLSNCFQLRALFIVSIDKITFFRLSRWKKTERMNKE